MHVGKKSGVKGGGEGGEQDEDRRTLAVSARSKKNFYEAYRQGTSFESRRPFLEYRTRELEREN